jgi:hypothetical protein
MITYKPMRKYETMNSMEKNVVKKRALLVLFICFCLSAAAQNPVIRDQFTADPTARVFDGKIYLYPSHDIPSPIERLKEWFCMADYHVFSSDNLTQWQDHGVIVSQENVPWVAPESYSMWAPDCVYRDGKYYFYFPSAAAGENRRGFAVGVAVSDKPYGPFIPEEQPIVGIGGIDPCVLIDRDGQAYIYWSGRGMSVARLKDNMVELDSAPVQIEGLPEGFKEGPFVFERKGIYYYTFPWVADKTEKLAYATGDNPMGPFEFKGVIMGESPTGCWTNHHSIVEYHDQWYLFYHHNDYSPAFDKNRATRIDSLFFNADGTIREVTPTLRGVGITAAAEMIHPDRYSAISEEGASIAFVDAQNPFEGWKTRLNEDGAWIRYNRVDFGEGGQQKVKVRISSASASRVGLQLTHPNRRALAEINVTAGNSWQEISLPVRDVPAGIHDIQLSLIGAGMVEIDWIRFE